MYINTWTLFVVSTIESNTPYSQYLSQLEILRLSSTDTRKVRLWIVQAVQRERAWYVKTSIARECWKTNPFDYITHSLRLLTAGNWNWVNHTRATTSTRAESNGCTVSWRCRGSLTCVVGNWNCFWQTAGYWCPCLFKWRFQVVISSYPRKSADVAYPVVALIASQTHS